MEKGLEREKNGKVGDVLANERLRLDVQGLVPFIMLGHLLFAKNCCLSWSMFPSLARFLA